MVFEASTIPRSTSTPPVLIAVLAGLAACFSTTGLSLSLPPATGSQAPALIALVTVGIVCVLYRSTHSVSDKTLTLYWDLHEMGLVAALDEEA